MAVLEILTAAAQVAAHLRKELMRGTWSGQMPGGDRLAIELGVGRDTIEAAMRQLEAEGFLLNRGRRRGRQIVLPKSHAPTALRVALLLPDRADLDTSLTIELRHLLEKAGHTPFFPAKTMTDLGMDADRVARFAGRVAADAWVIKAGSREILGWFAAQPLPVFALFGRSEGLPIAGSGPDKPPLYAAITRRLIGLGHQRITLLCRGYLRHPTPSPIVRAYLDEVEASGIQSGPFNLPEWTESRDGFSNLLDSLFHHTPPTALILDEPLLFNAAMYFAGKNGLRVPEDVSLICTDAEASFAWCKPSVAHIRWDYRPVVLRIVRWAANVARGKEYLRQTLTKAEFVDGGTVGRAPAER